MLAKMETFYDLDLASNVKLTIENAQDTMSKKSDYVREAFAPTNTSIAVSHELRKSSQYFVVSDAAKEHGFGVHQHNKLFLIYLPYSAIAYSMASTYTSDAGMTNVATEVENPLYFVFLSSVLGTSNIVEIPEESFKIICSTKYDVKVGYRLTYDSKDFVISDIERFTEGCNSMLLTSETRVTS